MSILSDRLSEDEFDFESPPVKKSQKTTSGSTRNNQKKNVSSNNRSRNDEMVEKRQTRKPSSSSHNTDSVKKKKRPQKEEFQEKELKAKSDFVLTQEDIDELNKIKEMSSDEAFAKEERRSGKIKKLTQIILILACSYLVMLIYGTYVTEYQYDENGEIAPVITSVQDIENKNEFLTLEWLYTEARNLYGDILVLDYRVASGIEDTLSIAPSYETAIDEVDRIAVQIDAATISSKYNQVRQMLYYFVSTELMSYCRYMSTAISQNDAAARDEALVGREVVLKSFTQITENMITLGGEINGYDVSDIKKWSPEGHVLEVVEGIKE